MYDRLAQPMTALAVPGENESPAPAVELVPHARNKEGTQVPAPTSIQTSKGDILKRNIAFFRDNKVYM